MEPTAGYLKDAAEYGDTRAITALADMIVSPDRKPDQKALDRALTLYKKAALQGDKLAAYRLNKMQVSGLSPEQQKFVDATGQFPGDYNGVCELYNWTQEVNNSDEDDRGLADFAFVASVVLPTSN
jgi:TPR repeat protein